MTTTQLVEVLASYSLQVFIVLISGKLLERALVRSTDRCAIWSICFFSVLFLGCTALVLPRLHLFQPWSLLGPHELLAVTEAETVVGKILLAIWSIGASVLLLRWAVRSYMLRRSLCRCDQLPKVDVQSLLEAADGMPIADKDLPIILISEDSDGPYCRQLHRPTIVLPRFLLAGDREDLRNVLIHELEHLKTNHPLQLFMQELAQIACWFHPTVWSAAWRASLVREFVCDDAASAQGANSAAYLRTLLHIAERCEGNKRISAIGFRSSQSEIVVRARRLVELASDSATEVHPEVLTRKVAISMMIIITCAASQIWIPTDPLASSRSDYSPWPTWSAETLHCFGCAVRDYEQFDRRVQLHEMRQTSINNDGTARDSQARDVLGS